MDEMGRQIEAMGALLDDIITTLGTFHEEQGKLLVKANEDASALAEQFNHSLGQLVRTLNGVWGAPEEAAILAVKE